MEETETRILNFDRLCRLCLLEKRILVDIFESNEDNSDSSIFQKIKACAKVELSEGDGLPTRICIPCLSSLNAAFDFRIQCENADKMLHDIYQLLVSVKSEKTFTVVEAAGENKELQPKQLLDVNHIFFIKKQNKQPTENNNVEEVENELVSATELFYVVDDTEQNVVNELVNVKEESAASSSSDLLSAKPDEMKMQEHLISFPVKKNLAEDINSDILDKKEETCKGDNVPKVKKNITSELKKSSCPFCHKVLSRVNEHIRLLHRNKVYICKKHDCGAEFLTLKNLQSHQLKCYNMEKPYKCKRCFKEFYRKCNYKSHIIRHSGKKDFQCQLCDNAYVDSTGLRRHFLKHHEPHQETFTSGCCGKKFKTKEGLRQHIRRGICGVQIFQILDSTSGE